MSRDWSGSAEGRRSGQARPLQRRRRRPTRWTAYVLPGFILATLAIIGIFALIALSWFMPAGREVVVPSFLGKTSAEAQSLADASSLGLRVIARRPDPQAAKDVVIGQLPPAGERVRERRPIELIVSDGIETVETPNVSQLTLSEAIAAVENARLQVGAVLLKSDSTAPSGTVIGQRPDPSAAVRVGATVDLIVAKGTMLLYVPNFVGLPINYARTAAKTLQLSLSRITQLPIREGARPKDVVEAQDPPAGERLLPQQAIALQVSGGAPPTPVPSPSAGMAESTPSLPSPTADRVIRIAVWLPLTAAKRNIRVVLEDATGSRVLYEQPTLGGFTLSFAETVRGAATVETYSDDALINATSL